LRELRGRLEVIRIFLPAQLWHRPARAATVGTAVAVAAIAFVLLTGSTASSELRVHRTLTANYRGAYDILVRPRGSFTPLERQEGLVRDNYLSGIFGGITMKKYRTIEKIPGVAVAAPIANIGTVLAEESVTVHLRHFVGSQKDQLFRVRFSWVTQNGLSRYPGADEYLYVTRRRMDLGPKYTFVVSDPLTGRQDMVCNGYRTTIPLIRAPFVPRSSSYLQCSADNLTSALRHSIAYTCCHLPPDVYFRFEFPINVAAIDPRAEARLVGLSRAMVSGRYLTGSIRPRHRSGNPGWLEIPVLAASRTFVHEHLLAQIERLVVPSGTDVPGMLGAGSCGIPDSPGGAGCRASVAVPKEPGPPGHPRATAYGFVTALLGVPIGERSFDAQRLYARRIRHSDPHTFTLSHIVVDAYWRGAPIRYRRLAPKALKPLTVENPPSTWQAPGADSGYHDQPTDNRDVQFHRVSATTGREGTVDDLSAEWRLPQLRVVGNFEPLRLRGFSALSKVPLETYYPPSLEPADARSRKLLGNRPLLPSQNIGDYEQQPPLLLTNLIGLPPLLSSERFDNVSPRQRRAPISVIRVRVKGVTGPNDLSETRIRTVAQLIHQRTGLDVDITAGSSPTPVRIHLPAGRYGRPPLELSEGWVKKGASVSYTRALDRKDLALFALILVVCALFLGNGAYAAIRSRRAEFGTLLTLGWSRAAIFRLVIADLLFLGVLAGIVGTGIAVLLVRLLHLHFPLLRALYVLPLAVLLATAGGILPAWQAARGRPLDAIRPVVTAGRRLRQLPGLVGMAVVNVARLPGRSLAGGLSLVLAVCALTVLYAIEHAFQGTLVATLLGNAVSLQVRSADFVALALTLALSALSAADVLYLNLRERQAEFVTLGSIGWSGREQQALVILEALVLAAGASLVGAAAGVFVGSVLLHVSLAPVLASAAVAGGAATATATIASILPLMRLRRLSAPEVLAAE
jgi:putative ABC transport system permease protein